MEYNKDEALRAKEIAERKLSEKDYNGAKKLLDKAERLYASLEGLPQLMAVTNVYIASQKKLTGDLTDWYGVLQVPTTADEITIKKQYRKLALMLHPDKNKSVAAEGAFKIVGEAWTVLSDTQKRLSYDCRIKVTSSITTTGAATNLNPTFWTQCPGCKMQYQYKRDYVNHNLLCQSCRNPFVAVEIAAPRHHNAGTGFGYHSGFTMPNGFPRPGFGGMYSGAHVDVQNRGFWSSGFVKDPTKNNLNGTGFAANGFNAAKTKVQSRTPKKTTPKTKGNGAVPKKQANGTGKGKVADPELPKKRKRTTVVSSDSSEDEDSSDVEEISSGDSSDDDSPVVEIFEVKSRAKDSGSLKKPPSKKHTESVKKPFKYKTDEEEEEEDIDEEEDGIDVPDADFHKFDEDRTETHFEPGQVWALYDDNGGMPRFYARISTIHSKEIFKARIMWLENDENLNSWVDAQLYPSCGRFKGGKRQVCDSVNLFSHLVNLERTSKGIYIITPNKGEVWATYVGWKSTWKDKPPTCDSLTYEMVEIITYSETAGVDVSPLTKIAGYKSVFRKRDSVLHIPSNQLLRFSHQVPAVKLKDVKNPGKKIPNEILNCWELDPAASPVY